MVADDDTAIAITVADPFARHLMAQYLERRAQDTKLIRAALADSDFDAIALIGHKLFGSGSAYGLIEVTRLGGQLESAAETRDSARIGALLGELEAYVNQLKLS